MAEVWDSCRVLCVKIGHGNTLFSGSLLTGRSGGPFPLVFFLNNSQGVPLPLTDCVQGWIGLFLMFPEQPLGKILDDVIVG